MQTGLWKMYGLRIWKLADLESLNAIEKSSGRVFIVRVSIDHRASVPGTVPFFTAGHAGMAANAGIEIDH